ncbi:hypothetical protein CRUP_001797 [Coryphaenoides rupestris]|nr:hypothetical protein CRUP_001797 [Coryphaenoides rupestris]
MTSVPLAGGREASERELWKLTLTPAQHRAPSRLLLVPVTDDNNNNNVLIVPPPATAIMSADVENTTTVMAAPGGEPSPASPAGTPTTPTAKAPGLAEKTDEYLLGRFKGDGVRYKAKLIGIDDVAEARGDKMSQDSMMKLKGMAVAARSQGKHKQRIWVNISMSGIRIIDEKSGSIDHEHSVNKISFIARDVTDNRAFGYAEPLVVDLKDLFQVIFNMRKKEAETSQKPMSQMDLFGDMSTPPGDQSSPVTPNSDPFRDDPFSKSPPAAPPAPPTAPHNAQTPLASAVPVPVPVNGEAIFNGGLHGEPPDYGRSLGGQMNGLTRTDVTSALGKGPWSLEAAVAQERSTVAAAVLEERAFQNPFRDASASSAAVSPPNGVTQATSATCCKDSVVLSPPPQNAKAGRSRRNGKSTPNDLFGEKGDLQDLFGTAAPPPEPQGPSPSHLHALENLQLGPPQTSCPPGTTTTMWGAPPATTAMFPMPGAVPHMAGYPGPPHGFAQPSAFGAPPVPPPGSCWAPQQVPGGALFGAVPGIPQPANVWMQPPPPGGAWGQPAVVMSNPFQPAPGSHVAPPRPPPRPPVSEAPPKVENSAFIALDPLGEKEKKTRKDMFKDFEIAKPPAIPDRKGNADAGSNGGGAFEQYFTKAGKVAQGGMESDDFDINAILAANAVAPPVAAVTSPAPAPGPGLDRFNDTGE